MFRFWWLIISCFLDCILGCFHVGRLLICVVRGTICLYTHHHSYHEKKKEHVWHTHIRGTADSGCSMWMSQREIEFSDPHTYDVRGRYLRREWSRNKARAVDDLMWGTTKSANNHLLIRFQMNDSISHVVSAVKLDALCINFSLIHRRATQVISWGDYAMVLNLYNQKCTLKNHNCHYNVNSFIIIPKMNVWGKCCVFVLCCGG